MRIFEEVKDKLYSFDELGIEISELGTTLIGKAKHIAPLAWLHSLYPTLTDYDIVELEKKLNVKIPKDYKEFLTKCSNGLTLFTSVFNLDGYRKIMGRSIEASRQPYSIITPNVEERPNNAKENYFFIGSYDWDNSKLYIDIETGKVHFCSEWDTSSLHQWDSFQDMLLSETDRLINLFDSDGKIINEDTPTTPTEA